MLPMHKSCHTALPSLRPISPAANLETPRGSFAKAIVAVNPRFSSDFEVNRSLFITDAKLVQTKAAPPKTKTKLLPMMHATRAAIQEAPTVQIPKDLEPVQALMERIPSGTDPVPLDDVYRLSPVLDRILCVVGEWKPGFIAENLSCPVVIDLHQRLFGLIDIDDFLVRTIVCRILLYFAVGSDSPLLLPISRIFYKLSCDPSNDLFFIDESLEAVLVSLLRISQPEGKVFTAGAIRNVAACEGMREKLANSEFLALATETLAMETDAAVKLQLIGAIRHLCKNETFRKKLAAAEVLVPLASDVTLFPDLMRIVSTIPELTIGEKLKLLRIAEACDLSDAQNRRAVIRALTVLTVGTENESVCWRLALTLLKASVSEPDYLAVILPIGERLANVPQCVALFQSDEIFFNLARSQEHDTSVRIGAYTIVKKFKGEAAAAVVSECSLLDEIDLNSFPADH
jgi:hypothetical protein